MLNLGDGEYWKKVMGPVFIYLNSSPNNGSDIRALWDDAKAQARAEAGNWPYSFPDRVAGLRQGGRQGHGYRHSPGQGRVREQGR